MPRRLALLAALAAACVAAAPATAQTELTVSLWIPPTHMIARDIIMPWAADVEQATGGRVKFKLLPKAVANPIQHFDAVRDGLADVGFISHSYTPQRFQLTRIGVLPFSGDNALSNSVALWRVYDRYLAGANEHRGVKVITPDSSSASAAAWPPTSERRSGPRSW
jgi:TRAP-type C4-dicarboxylate transport system substrate-binding protein